MIKVNGKEYSVEDVERGIKEVERRKKYMKKRKKLIDKCVEFAKEKGVYEQFKKEVGL